MPENRLGNFAYLRSLTDLLVPRSKELLPAKVSKTDWQCVIPYNTDLDITRLFLIDILDYNPHPYTGANIFQVTVGSTQQPGINFGLPAGFVYELVDLDVAINTNVLPVAGDLLNIRLDLFAFNVTLTDVAGGADLKTIYQNPVVNQRRTQMPPYLLDPIALTYSWHYPSGVYRTINGEDVAYDFNEPILLPCPVGTEGGWFLQLTITKLTTLYAASNWDANSNIDVRIIFRRRPIANYDVRGLYNSM